MPAVRSDSNTSATRKKAKPSAPCDVCGTTVARASDMSRHKAIHLEKTFLCQKSGCTYASRTASGLKVHTDGHENKVKECPAANCTYASHDPATLLRHRVKKHQYVPRKVAPKGRKAKDHVPPCVPAAVRRTIAAQENTPQGLYEQFAIFPMGSTSSTVSTPAPTDTLSDLSALTEYSDSDSESNRSASPTPSYSSTSSSDISLPDIAVIQRENAIRAARRVHYMTSEPRYLTPEMLAHLKAVSNTKTQYDQTWSWAAEPRDSKTPALTSQAHPQFSPYTAQTAPGYQAVGFKESDYQCRDVIVSSASTMQSDLDVSMTALDLIIDNTQFRLDDILAAAAMLEKIFLPSSFPFFKSLPANENIPLVTPDALHIEGEHIGCYTDVAIEEIPEFIDAEEDRSSVSPPAYFTSWSHFLHGPLTATDSVVRPADQ